MIFDKLRMKTKIPCFFQDIFVLLIFRCIILIEVND